MQSLFGRAASQCTAARALLANAMSDLMTAVDQDQAAYTHAGARFRMPAPMSPNNNILGGRLGLGLDAGTARF